MWPYIEDDHMEIGNTGWVCVGEGLYRNIKTGHIIDETGSEYDENGILIQQAREDEENN